MRNIIPMTQPPSTSTDLGVLIGPVRGEMMKERTGEIQASGLAGTEGAGRAAPKKHQSSAVFHHNSSLCKLWRIESPKTCSGHILSRTKTEKKEIKYILHKVIFFSLICFAL